MPETTNTVPPPNSSGSENTLTFSLFGLPITLSGQAATQAQSTGLFGSGSGIGIGSNFNLLTALGIDAQDIEHARLTALKYLALFLLVIILIAVLIVSAKAFIEK